MDNPFYVENTDKLVFSFFFFFVNHQLDGITVLLISDCGRIIHTNEYEIIFN